MIALIFGLVGLIIDIVVILAIAGGIISLPFYLAYKLIQVIKN